MAVGFQAAFARLGHVPGVGIALGLVLVGGLILVVRARGRRGPLGELAAPIALLAGALVFLIVTGTARAGQGGLLVLVNGTGPERARDSRYVYLVAAMTLPALVLAADALIRRWRLLAIPIVGLLLVGLPGNVRVLATCTRLPGTPSCSPASLPPFGNAAVSRQQILAIPHLPLAEQLRGSSTPVPITPGARGAHLRLVARRRHGRKASRPRTFDRVPDLDVRRTVVRRARASDVTPAVRAGAEARGTGTREGSDAHVRTRPRPVAYTPLLGTPSFPVTLRPSTVVALVGPLRLRIVPIDPGVLLCE